MTKGEIPFRDVESNAVTRFSMAFEARFDKTSADEWSGWANTTLGSQDTEFADHLLAANARFAIIEFKARLETIGTEAGKGLRQKLFKELAGRRDLLKRCLDLHMICWSTIETHQPDGFPIAINEEVDKLDRYAVMVAPFLDVSLKLPLSRPMDTALFLDRFLGARTFGGSYARFRRYLDELGEIAGGANGDSSTIQGMVCIYLPGNSYTSGRYAHTRFRGLEELQRLMNPKILEKGHRLERSRSLDPKPGPDRGGPSWG